MSLAHGFLIWEIRKTQSTKPPSLPMLITSSGVPKTSLRVSNLLEELTELTESCYTHSYTSLQLKRQSKISQGKWCMGQSLGKFQISNYLLPVESRPTLLSQKQCVTCMGYCQAGKLTKAFICRIFVGAPWSSAPIAGLSTASPEIKLIPRDSKSPHKSHC